MARNFLQCRGTFKGRGPWKLRSRTGDVDEQKKRFGTPARFPLVAGTKLMHTATLASLPRRA